MTSQLTAHNVITKHTIRAKIEQAYRNTKLEVSLTRRLMKMCASCVLFQ